MISFDKIVQTVLAKEEGRGNEAFRVILIRKKGENVFEYTRFMNDTMLFSQTHISQIDCSEPCLLLVRNRDNVTWVNKKEVLKKNGIALLEPEEIVAEYLVRGKRPRTLNLQKDYRSC